MGWKAGWPVELAAAGAASLLLAGTLTACTRNNGEDSAPRDQQQRQAAGVIATDPAQSRGPAAEVPGAKKGGTLHLIDEQDFLHLDPQRIYVADATAVGQLFLRALTMFKEDGRGTMTLVGDLAEDAGKDVKGDCTQWEYRLKEGVRFEDGRPVTAGDVAYGIARSFAENIADGPTYIQEWLAGTGQFTKVYPGPYAASTTVPGLRVNDDRTLTFTLDAPRCDLPFALSLGTSVPVPRDRDTRTEYDRRPVASGPYRIKEHIKDTRLVLERNPYWDPGTDPVRHAYPDQVAVEFGPNDTAQTERMIADSGADQYAVPYNGVPQALTNQVLGNPALKERTIDRPGIFMWYLTINNERIKDVNVRRAIAYALDKQGVLTTQGGDAAGKVRHTLLTDTTAGWQDYPDPYDGGPHGDPAKARQLLGGRKVKLVFVARNTTFGQATAPVVEQSLERAGFDVTVRYLDRSAHDVAVRTRGNPYDIHLSSWYADWPSAASTIPPLWDGRQLGPEGNSDVSYFNADDVNARIDELLRLPASEAVGKWADVDRMIMERYAPVVPIFQSRQLAVIGSKVAGTFVSDVIGTCVFYDTYLR